MPIVEFSARDQLVIDLALQVEDPAGIEAIQLAQTLLEIFSCREPRQAELMRESLHRWSMQWPRRGVAVPIVNAEPDEPYCRHCNWPERLCTCTG